LPAELKTFLPIGWIGEAGTRLAEKKTRPYRGYRESAGRFGGKWGVGRGQRGAGSRPAGNGQRPAGLRTRATLGAKHGRGQAGRFQAGRKAGKLHGRGQRA
jgi:hypothetical protein